MARHAYAWWNEGREEDLLASFHPDVVYLTSGTFPGLDAEYRGRTGLRRFRAEMLEAWEAFDVFPSSISEREGAVVIQIRFKGVGRGSGIKVELDFHHVATIEDGLVRRFAASPDLDAAFASLRESEPDERV